MDALKPDAVTGVTAWAPGMRQAGRTRGQPVHCLTATLCGLGLATFPAHAESLDDLAGIVRVEHTRSFSDVDRLAYTVQTSPTEPLDVRAGTEVALARVVHVFGAARPVRHSPRRSNLCSSTLRRHAALGFLT